MLHAAVCNQTPNLFNPHTACSVTLHHMMCVVSSSELITEITQTKHLSINTRRALSFPSRSVCDDIQWWPEIEAALVFFISPLCCFTSPESPPSNKWVYYPLIKVVTQPAPETSRHSGSWSGGETPGALSPVTRVSRRAPWSVCMDHSFGHRAQVQHQHSQRHPLQMGGAVCEPLFKAPAIRKTTDVLSGQPHSRLRLRPERSHSPLTPPQLFTNLSIIYF